MDFSTTNDSLVGSDTEAKFLVKYPANWTSHFLRPSCHTSLPSFTYCLLQIYCSWWHRRMYNGKHYSWSLFPSLSCVLTTLIWFAFNLASLLYLCNTPLPISLRPYFAYCHTSGRLLSLAFTPYGREYLSVRNRLCRLTIAYKIFQYRESLIYSKWYTN